MTPALITIYSMSPYPKRPNHFGIDSCEAEVRSIFENNRVKKMSPSTQAVNSSRRAFIRNGSLFLLSASTGIHGGCNPRMPISPEQTTGIEPNVRFGLVTDIHYADKEAAGTRFYRESLGKLREAVNQFQISRPQFVIALGDVIDAADEVETEQAYLKSVSELLSSAPGQKHYVLGNHCVNTLTKEEFLDGVDQQESFYSFDVGDVHFVILDACFREDGQSYGRNNFTWTDSNIPEEELTWLASDLALGDSMTIVLIHQRLDESENYSVKNASQVRALLEDSGRVRAVFQGHSHANSLQEIGGIHYCVLAAMIEGSGVENSGYSTIEIAGDGTICVSGFRKQSDYCWLV